MSIVLVLVFLFTGCSSLPEQDNVDEPNMTAPVDVSISLLEVGNDATILLIFEVSGSGQVTTGKGEVDSGYFKAIDDNNVSIDLPGKKGFAIIPMEKYEALVGGLFIFMDNAVFEKIEDGISKSLVNKIEVVTGETEERPGLMIIIKGKEPYQLKVMQREIQFIDSNLRHYRYTIGTD